jgi:hypothetical protein
MNKLMHGAHARKYGMVSHLHMPCHLGVVAHDAVVANDAVVRYVAICHDKAIVAHLRHPFVLTSSVDRYEFANGSIVSDFNGCIFTLKLQILWNPCNDSTRKNTAIASDSSAFHDGDVASNPCSAANLHILMDHAERINLYVWSQLRIGVDIGMGMNHFSLTFCLD